MRNIALQNAWRRNKYAINPEHRRKIKAVNAARWLKCQTDIALKERTYQRSRERHAARIKSDPAYRLAKREALYRWRAKHHHQYRDYIKPIFLIYVS